MNAFFQLPPSLFHQIAPMLPQHLQNAAPIIVVSPVGVGKSCLTLATANYLQQNQVAMQLGPVDWSVPIWQQWERLAVEQKGTSPTEPISKHEVEYVGFRLLGKQYVIIAVAGEDLCANGIDVAQLGHLLRDAIVVFAYHPLLCVDDDFQPTPALFAVRSMAFQIAHSFKYTAAEAFEASLRLMLRFERTTGFNADYDRLRETLRGASFSYEPTGATAATRFLLTHPNVTPEVLEQCDVALAEVICSVVRKWLPTQRQLEAAITQHPRVIRKLVRLDLFDLAPANAIYPDDILRKRLGPTTHQITAGGADLRSRLQRSRDGLLVIEGTNSEGPRQLLAAIEEMVKRESTAKSRAHRAKLAAMIAGVCCLVLSISWLGFGAWRTLVGVGVGTLIVGAVVAAVAWMRAMPHRPRSTLSGAQLKAAVNRANDGQDPGANQPSNGNPNPNGRLQQLAGTK